MEIQVTLVPVELVWMAHLAILDHQDHQAGRVPQGMPFLPDQVFLAYLVTLGLWGQRDLVVLLEAQGLLVSIVYVYKPKKPLNNIGFSLQKTVIILSIFH